MLGHELRNPLTPLVTAVKLIELKSGGSFQRELAVVIRQTEKLSRLVDDISDVSRFTHNKMHLRRGAVEVGQVVGEASEMVAPLIAREKHTLNVDVPDGLVMEGDSVRLTQAVANLLTNAAKYTPPGGRIDVSGDAEGAQVVLRVKDNGVGISSEFLPVIFEPFTQKRESLDRADGGLGLGLAITQGIVQAHGGTIEAYSDGAGHGSEFIVRLPVMSPTTSVVRDNRQTMGEPDPAESM